jgi:hypothetical protein
MAIHNVLNNNVSYMAAQILADMYISCILMGAGEINAPLLYTIV